MQCQVVVESSLSSSRSGRAGSLAARRPELAEITASLDDVVAGRGRLVLAVREPGPGPACLATAIAGAAEARGFAVAWGRCGDGGGAAPLAPWRQVFAALGQHLPAVSTEPTLAADGARLEVFEAAVAALARLGGARPLLVVLDELHLADVWSLSLLQYVSRALRDDPRRAPRGRV